MRLRTRLVLLIAIASLGPLGVLGLGATSVSSRLMGEKVTELQSRTADGLALYVDTWLSQQLRLLGQQARAFNLSLLDETSRTGFLRLVYNQVPEAAVVALIDAAGQPALAPVFRPVGDSQLPQREEVSEARAKALLARLPSPRATEPALGAPRVVAGASPTVPLVLPASASLRLAVELSLGPILAELARQGGPERDVVLLDAAGAPVLPGTAGLVDPDVFRRLAGAAASDVRYSSPEGIAVIASCAPVPLAGWTVAVAEPMVNTTAATAQIRARTTYVAGVAALLSLVLGALFAREISRPVVSLKEAALAVAEGDFGRRVQPPATGEIAELMRAFNFMSGRLERDRQEIDAKNREIEAFNRELQQRVEERTAELRAAQEQLVQSARLAAAGELGAGLAHELNNPLAGVLGLTQVMLLKAPEGSQREMLRSVEEQTLRCKEIVARMLRFTQESPSGLDPARRDVVDLEMILDEVLALVRGPFLQRGVTVEHQRAEALPVRGDRTQLGAALAQLLTGVRAAAGAGGTVHIHGARAEGQVELVMTLRVAGAGVARDDWMAAGLAIWAARRTLADHGGKLVEPGIPAGPAGPDAAQLAWRVVLPEA